MKVKWCETAGHKWSTFRLMGQRHAIMYANRINKDLIMSKKSYFLQISVIVKITISEASCIGNKMSNSTGSCTATSNFYYF